MRRIELVLSDMNFRLIGEAAEKYNCPIPTYIVNTVMDSIMGNKESGVSEITTEDLMSILENNDFNDDEIGTFFMLIVQKMTQEDLEVAIKLLSNIQTRLRKSSPACNEGIYADLPPMREPVKRMSPDAQGVSNDLAEDVIEDQGDVSHSPEFLQKIAELHAIEITKRGAKNYEDVSIESLAGPEWEKDYSSDTNNEENILFADDDDDDDEFDPEDALLDENDVAFEMREVFNKENKGRVLSALAKELGEPAANEPAKPHKAVVESASIDPDNDSPDWSEDISELRDRATGIDPEASERVINEAKNSVTGSPKEPKVLRYDPRDPRIKTKNVSSGPYTNYPREKVTAKEKNQMLNQMVLSKLGE